MRERRVTVVRPYGTTIRRRVFGLLQRLGCSIAEEDIIPPHTSDDEAMKSILAGKNRVLLIPFHGHRDGEGQRVDGLVLVRRLRQQHRGFPWRVVMPVSAFGKAALTLALENEADPSFGGKVLYLEMDELEDPRTLTKLRAHLR